MMQEALALVLCVSAPRHLVPRYHLAYLVGWRTQTFLQNGIALNMPLEVVAFGVKQVSELRSFNDASYQLCSHLTSHVQRLPSSRIVLKLVSRDIFSSCAFYRRTLEELAVEKAVHEEIHRAARR
jgi:hypothetical protein